MDRTLIVESNNFDTTKDYNKINNFPTSKLNTVNEAVPSENAVLVLLNYRILN